MSEKEYNQQIRYSYSINLFRAISISLGVILVLSVLILMGDLIDVAGSSVPLIALLTSLIVVGNLLGYVELSMSVPQTGGSQEFGQRAATENIPLIAGMAAAFELVQVEHDQRTNHILPLRDHLINQVLKIPSSQLTGHPEERLVNHASFVFEGVDGNLLISILDGAGFACSSGSACKTGDTKPSSVLTHLGYTPSWALGSLRVTLGKDTSAEDIDSFLKVLPGCIHQVRELKS